MSNVEHHDPDTGTDAASVIEPIRRSIDVSCDRATAFAYFIDHFSEWWPAGRHSVSAMNDGPGAAKVVMEPSQGGRIYEVTHDGREIEWGKVESFDDNERLILSWHPGSGSDAATEVEFQFVETGPDACRVDLTHRGWNRLGPDAAGMRDSYANGWIYVFDTCLANGLSSA